MGSFSGWGKGDINLANNFVFYEHLGKSDGPAWRQRLYGTITNRLDNMVSTNMPQPNSKAIDQLKQMAIQERKKEQDFINNAFNLSLNFQLDQNNTKDFIECFNTYMQLNKVYDMRKSLLLHNFGEEGAQNLKDAYSFFNTYLADSFHRSNVVKSNIVDIIINSSSEQDAETKINNYINQVMPQMVTRSLDKISRAKANNSKNLSEQDRRNIEEGLRAISEVINKLGKTNFGRQIIAELGLQNFSSVIAKNASSLYSQKNLADLSSKVSQAVKESNAYLTSSVHTSGGLILELVENAGLQAIASTIKGKHIKVLHTGQYKGKPDNIMIVMNKPIPTQQIQNVFNELSAKQTSRENNIEAIEKLESVLGKNNSGFIIYFSDKNHFMNTILKDSDGKVMGKKLTGFTGGSQSLKNFEPVMSSLHHMPPGVKVGAIIQAIMQTLSGAVGYDQKEDIRSWLATLFAYFLFDDLGSIGTQVKGSNLTSLHIMNLNGVYIPLSVILDRFAAALQSAQTKGMSSPSAFVNASISAPKIKYDYDNYDEYKPDDSWFQQRKEAYEQVTVGVTFLKNIRELVSGYLDSIV